ncbi:MAG: DUF6036 family nucleotidyltransferase [Gaiella sp.]
MKRHEFEHVLKAAADIVRDDLVVIGSQALLGRHPDAPSSLLVSMEVDVYPATDPGRADEIDGAIGEGSRFHDTYAYYAHGVGPETPIAPAGWEGRRVRLELPRIRPKEGTFVAWCMSTADLVLAKLAAGRPHDLEFAVDAIAAGLVEADQLLLGVDLMPEKHREPTRQRLGVVLARLPRPD